MKTMQIQLTETAISKVRSFMEEHGAGPPARRRGAGRAGGGGGVT
jgi:hypothetical protein